MRTILQGGVVDAEEDDVAALGGDLAAGEEVGTLTKVVWVAEDLFESGPECVEIDFFLSGAPGLECVVADGLEVCDGGGGEFQGHGGGAPVLSFEFLVEERFRAQPKGLLQRTVSRNRELFLTAGEVEELFFGGDAGGFAGLELGEADSCFALEPIVFGFDFEGGAECFAYDFAGVVVEAGIDFLFDDVFEFGGE